MSELLFLAHRVPIRPDRGDRIRSFNVLRYLSARIPVHLVAFTDDGDIDLPPSLTAALASFAIIPRTKSRVRAALEAVVTGQAVSVAAFADPAMQRAVDEVLSQAAVRSIYCFSGQMAQYLPRDGRRTLMDFVDVDSAKFADLAGSGAWPARWMMKREARLLGVFEHKVAEQVDAAFFISKEEAGLFGSQCDKLHVIGNGVDTCYFDPHASFRTVEKTGPLIVFTGQMDYRPNIEAVRSFVVTALPRIRHHHPMVRFAVVGRAPHASVRELASDLVTVTGAVEDVRGWLQAADVCVAPLRIARGVQNKVLEAMAMARPVVASGAAATGIDHGGTIIVADGETAFADAVLEVLDDHERASVMGEGARVRVVERYSWAARLKPIDALLGLPDGRQSE